MDEGTVQSFVVKDKEHPETVARAVQTSLKRRYVPPKDLDRMIREIEEESIEAFKDPVLVKERQERLRLITQRLGLKKNY